MKCVTEKERVQFFIFAFKNMSAPNKSKSNVAV